MKKSAIIFLAFVLALATLLFSCKKNNPSSPSGITCTATITTTSTKTTSTATATPTSTATATPTVTATIDSGTVSGNLILPSAQPGTMYEVLIDTDMDFGNGITNMTIGYCGASANVPYSITAPAGTYYVYAVVKTVSCTTCPPEAGDYLGRVGSTYPAYPGSANVPVTNTVNLTGQDITMVQGVNNVTGSITTSANCDGKNMILIASTALDPNNGVFYDKVMTISGSTGTGPYTFNYSMLACFPGSFYFIVQVATDGHALPGAPEAGDFVGDTGPQTIDPTISNGPYNFTTIQE